MNLLAGTAAAVLTGAGVILAGLVGYTALTAARIERAIPADGQFIDVRGARLHYVDAGRGPALVIVHGLGGQLRNFRYALLKHLTPYFRVILVDRPGSGYSRSTTKGFPGLRAQAAAVADLIRILKLDRPLLVGHSLGGALSLALASDDPSVISGLALIAPLTQHDLDEVPPAFRMLAIHSTLVRKLLSWTVVAPMAAMAGPERRSIVFKPDPVPDDFEVAGGGMLSRRPKGFQAASADLVQVPIDMPAIEAAYPRLGVPLDILFGRQDAILDPMVHGARLANQAPGARLALVDGGHMLPVTQPELTADWIRDVHRRQSG